MSGARAPSLRSSAKTIGPGGAAASSRSLGAAAFPAGYPRYHSPCCCCASNGAGTCRPVTTALYIAPGLGRRRRRRRRQTSCLERRAPLEVSACPRWKQHRLQLSQMRLWAEYRGVPRSVLSKACWCFGAPGGRLSSPGRLQIINLVPYCGHLALSFCGISPTPRAVWLARTAGITHTPRCIPTWPLTRPQSAP